MAHARRMCHRCKKHPAIFRVRGGRVQSDNQHDLCPQCTRAEKNRQRVKSLRPRQ